MTPLAERYARVHAAFEATVDLSPPERATVLDQFCGDDEALRREVESLLKADTHPDLLPDDAGFSIPRELLEETPEQQLACRKFGPYEIVREIGRGGLGSVYLALRSDGEYRKEVAIKLIRRGLDTEDILRRFRTERQIIAQLDHPNIARLIDGGTADDGLPYFAMEYVKGEPITTYCETHRLDTSQRLVLFRKVCAAVTYAHQNLVIHRDLKPSNILVTAEGEPKLLDLGIAKLLTAEDNVFTITAPALRAMTLDYASPEQIRGEKITTASDVYSLGVFLYELLTGEKAYRLTSSTSEELTRAINEQEARRPKSLPRDLANIVAMAMRKDAARRYLSVGQMSEDVRRYLENRPVIARQDTLAYRTGKFVRRNKLGVAAAVVVLLTLTAGIGVTVIQAKRVTVERDRARKEAAKASRISAFLQNVIAFSDPSWRSSNPDKTREASVSEALDEASRRVENELADQPEVAAAIHFTVGWTYGALGKLDKAEPHLRSALDIRRRVLGPVDQETAQSMAGLGELFLLRGNFKEAETMAAQAVAVYRKAQAKGDVDAKGFATALNALSLALHSSKGEYARCEALTREAIAISANLTGADRARVLDFYSNLAAFRDEQGDLDGAITYNLHALEEQSRLPGNSRMEMDTQLNNRGVYLLTKGDFKEAEPILLEAVDIALKKFGENHHLTALYLANLELSQRKRRLPPSARRSDSRDGDSATSATREAPGVCQLVDGTRKRPQRAA